jgi:hypothetical protein
MGRACSMHGEIINSSRILVGRKRDRSENNIKTDLREISWVWIGFIYIKTAAEGELLGRR